MKKKALLGLAAALAAAGALAAVKLFGQPEAAPDAPPAESGSAAPAGPGRTVAFPLKNKYAGYPNGPDDPVYLFELETPSGTKEIAVSKTLYETYYIGDEVVCAETEKGPQVI